MSEFHNTVYYENCTDIGGWDSHEVVNGTWETFDQAKHDMKNYASALSAKGSGWINRVTISSNSGKVTVDRETVYRNFGKPGAEWYYDE